MPSRIHLLPDHLISKIAAGEVIERPASVVKELIENSLDAGATRVDVELETGGKRRIVVIDDGHGMSVDDALLAFDRHATSKIATFEDLERVGTLGFRGEALAAIAAVARVELLTVPAAGEGTRVRIEGGRVLRAGPAAGPPGTRLEVASLFWNVPARRKFQKTTATELRRAVEVVQGYALARPDLAFRVRHEGRELLEATQGAEGPEGARARIGELFGRELEDQLVAIPLAVRGEERIFGWLGGPAGSRTRRLFVFVNGRLLRDRAILATFYRSVRDEWHTEEFPPLFLFLQVAPGDLDVNVHPQKSEVRFRDRSFLDRVAESIRIGLVARRGTEDVGPRPLALGSVAMPAWIGLGGRGGGDEIREGEPRLPSPAGEAGLRLAQVSYEPASSPAPVPMSGRRAVPSLRVVGQYKGSLVLVEAPDGLWLVDQHAAHERILYEELSASFEAQEPSAQRLLVPRLLELSAPESLRLAELGPDLEALGFSLEALSGHDAALTAAPSVLPLEQAVEIVLALASDDEPRPDGGVEVRRRVLWALAASRACKAAIKIHRPLPLGEMEALLSRLFACEQPHSCPHGRPTILAMGDAELERRFGRRG